MMSFMPPKRPRPPKSRPSAASKGIVPFSPTRKSGLSPGGGLQRLQKVLAAAGLGSRRQCEDLITTGRVEVDRRVVTELGTRVDPAKQAIRVNGVALRPARLEYLAVNKPSGVLCTNRDPSGRARVVDLIDARAPGCSRSAASTCTAKA